MLVLKFGGASLASSHHILQAVSTILEVKKRVKKVVVVVSAMGNMTDQLYDLARQVSVSPAKRELDMLVSSGERISMALLAMALKERGCDAVSFTGSQSGIITSTDHQEALIKELKLHRLKEALADDKVVIIAGFQGMSKNYEITTLGRGGSDTSSVALGVGLKSEGVIFYKDVLGVYTSNPKEDESALLIDEMSHEQAMSMSQEASFVIHHRAIALAAKYGLSLTIQHYDGALRRAYRGTKIVSKEGRALQLMHGEAEYE